MLGHRRLSGGAGPPPVGLGGDEPAEESPQAHFLISSFFMPSFDIESLDIASLDVESFDIESFDIESFDIESFDIESFCIESSFDIESFFMSSAKALGANASPNDRVTAARTMAARLIMLQNLLEDIFQLATGVALFELRKRPPLVTSQDKEF